MDYMTIIQTMMGLIIAYSFKRQYDMEKKVSDHETRIKVEESKGEERDKVAGEIKGLLHDIADDIGKIKQEQGYWRGMQDGQKRKD